jgi:uncharacterized protein DUF4230
MPAPAWPGSNNFAWHFVLFCDWEPMASKNILPPSTAAATKSRRTPLLLIVAFGAGILACWTVLSLVAMKSASWNLWSALTQRSRQIDVSQPTVVDRIQQLQRLETVVYSMDKVVTGKRENSILPDFLAGDKLLLLVHGQVIAGIDFAALRASQVRVEGKLVRLRLPEPQVLTTRLDNDKTRVYSRETGLLVPTDPNLESEVRREAEHQLQAAALADGVLETARKNAQSTVTSLLLGMGFEKVEFE